MNNKLLQNYFYFPTILILSFVTILPNTAYSQSSERSIEENLAIIDGDYNPSASTIAKYSKELDELENYCSDKREMISDMTVKAKQILKNNEGIEISAISLLKEFNEAIPTGAKPGQYGECSSILAGLMGVIVQNN